MEDCKRKAVEVTEVEPIQGMAPMTADQAIVFRDENGINRVGALRRLRSRRLAGEGFGCYSALTMRQRQFVAKPILPPPPPTREVNPFTAQFNSLQERTKMQ